MREKIKKAIALNMPYRLVERTLATSLAARGAKEIDAAVLILFGESSVKNGIQVFYAKRTASVATHKSQMAFPGGHCELEDQGSAILTALREANEEIGLERDQVEVLGEMPRLSTATGYSIRPVVGYLTIPTEEAHFKLDPHEFDAAIWVPLVVLFDPKTYREEKFLAGDREYPIDVFNVPPYRIWGATGTMTRNLLDRLLQVQTEFSKPASP